MNRSRFLTLGLGLAIVTVLAACSEPTALVVDEEVQPEFYFGGGKKDRDHGDSPLICPTHTTRSATGIIRPNGGTVKLDGHSVTFPAGAVTKPTEVTIRTPASRYLIVNLRADGQEYPTFRKPVTVTISYDRCKGRIDPSDLVAYQIDPNTGELIEQMPSSVNPVRKTVTFKTSHFSHFVIAD